MREQRSPKERCEDGDVSCRVGNGARGRWSDLDGGGMRAHWVTGKRNIDIVTDIFDARRPTNDRSIKLKRNDSRLFEGKIS